MITVNPSVGTSARITGGGTSGDILLPYTVIGATSADVAVVSVRNYLLDTVGNPPSIGSLVLDDISAEETIINVWECVARWKTYAMRSRPATGESQFSFEMGFEPAKIMYAPGGMTVYKKSGVSDWTPQMLNDRGDGETPEGVEVPEPTYKESETHWIPTSSLTTAYRNSLKSLVGKTNNAAFKGWAAGEVLLEGVSGTRRGADDSEVTFRWAVRENQTGLTIGSVTGVNKEGWQYVWPRSQIVRNSNAPASTQITHVCIATVFGSGNFSQLNIGV